MLYQTEFPDYPAEAMPAIPDGFTDRSWRNEPCPCFIHEASGLVLWVDFPDPKARHYGTPSARYVLQRCTNRHPQAGWQFDDGLQQVTETDDWQDILAHIAAE